MSSLADLEKFISELSPSDFQKFREWFWEFDNARWDVKIQRDLSENKLSFLAEEALKEYKAGKSTEL